MTEELLGEWVECVVDSDYEIFTEYPYPIRRFDSDRIIRENVNSSGYISLNLNGKKYLKHRIVAEQFIINDDPVNNTVVDHIDHNKLNNHMFNLRWVSQSENCLNRSGYGIYKYVFLDELPDTAEPLDAYNGHEFDGLFIDYENEKLYKFNGVKFRELICCMTHGNIYYYTKDIEGKRRALPHKILFD